MRTTTQTVIPMKIKDKFTELKSRDEGALIAYICAGDPTPEATAEIVHALVSGGADIIELGLPFSDPIADGPTIQASIERALDAGMNPDIFFDLVRSLDADVAADVPLVVMTYYNLIFKRGLERFVTDCVDSGISGIIVPDLPVEESDDLAAQCKKHGVNLIFLIAPTTYPERMKKIAEKGSGFIYLVARTGVTGARVDVADSTISLIEAVRSTTRTSTPLAVGFGISTGDQASAMIKAGADGAIVGSAFVNIIADCRDVPERVEQLTRELKAGCCCNCG
ncbi:MAG: tryptophan synthase subunit alpha [Euryarchaeota archaeon]|nr:tryptophan synthase subunit alpha [Euryarchaeota archaeon]